MEVTLSAEEKQRIAEDRAVRNQQLVDRGEQLGRIIKLLRKLKCDWAIDENFRLYLTKPLTFQFVTNPVSAYYIPKHLISAVRRIRYWKWKHNYRFRIHDCDLSISSSTEREQIEQLIRSCSTKLKYDIEEILAYQLPPESDIEEAQGVVRAFEKRLPGYRLELFGSHTDGTSVQGVSDIDIRVYCDELESTYKYLLGVLPQFGYTPLHQLHSVRVIDPRHGEIDLVPTLNRNSPSAYVKVVELRWEK